MAVNIEVYKEIEQELSAANVTLVAVSKTKPVEDIMELYEMGQRDFGENYVQELVDKAAQLPKDIRWHFIGHLQRNKVKYIASFVHLVHGVDSFKLLEEINKQGQKENRIINCLLQVHIAKEETKFGFNEEELNSVLENINQHRQRNQLQHVNVQGLMGMASFTDDVEVVRGEFSQLNAIFHQLKTNDHRLHTLSMGMSGDYKIAMQKGSSMVRIGSLLFGQREKKH